MKILLKQHEQTVAAALRSANVALIAGFSILGIACVYFVALYLVSH